MIDKYWQIATTHWVVIALIFLLAIFFGLIVYYQFRRNNQFNFVDTLLDPVTHKASQNAVIIYAMAGVSIWYVVVKTTNPAAGNVGADLVQILLVFLVYRGAKEGIEAWKVRPPPIPPTPPPQGDNVGLKVEGQVDPRAAANAISAASAQSPRPTGAVKLPSSSRQPIDGGS